MTKWVVQDESIERVVSEHPDLPSALKYCADRGYSGVEIVHPDSPYLCWERGTFYLDGRRVHADPDIQEAACNFYSVSRCDHD